MKVHELARYFPTIEGESFDRFVEDIEKNGQLEPIITYRGEILDGVNRYRACQRLGMDPITKEYAGSDPLHYVISINVHRRHMSASQLAMVATEMLPEFEVEAKKRSEATQFGHGPRTTPTEDEKGKASDKVAEEFGISGKSVRRAKRVKEQAPEKVEAIIQGKENIRAVDTGLRMKAAQERAEGKTEKEVVKKIKETPKAVKDYFNALKEFDNQIGFALRVANEGMFSPEAINIIKSKHNIIKSKMYTLEELV